MITDIGQTQPLVTKGLRKDDEIAYFTGQEYSDTNSFLLGYSSFLKTDKDLPNYWSKSRESALYKAAIQNTFLSSVVQNITFYLTQLEWYVGPRESGLHNSDSMHYEKIAKRFWENNIDNVIFDMLVHDSGGTVIAVDELTNIDEPIIGEAKTLRYVPNYSIEYLGSDTTPIRIYDSLSNKHVNVHSSRIHQFVLLSNRSSATDKIKVNIGLSFVSKAYQIAELLKCMHQYDYEMLSGQTVGNIIFGTDVSGRDLRNLWKSGIEDARNAGLSNADAVIFVGAKHPNSKLEVIPIKKFPEGLARDRFLKDGLELLALAAGVDKNVLITGDSSGTTKSAALISDLKGRGKLDLWFLRKIKALFENYLLPAHLEVKLGSKNAVTISETQAKSRITAARAVQLAQKDGAISQTSATMSYRDLGVISEAQYWQDMLQHNRSPLNGSHISTVFYLNDSVVKGNTEGLPDDPCRIQELDLSNYADLLEELICKVKMKMANTDSISLYQKHSMSLTALEWLFGEIVRIDNEEIEEEFQEQLAQQPEPEVTEDDGEITDEEVEDESAIETKKWKKPKKRKKRRVLKME